MNVRIIRTFFFAFFLQQLVYISLICIFVMSSNEARHKKQNEMENKTFNPEYFIEYANANTRFFVKRKQFTGPNAFDDAVKWGRENIHNFNIDMIILK